MSRTALLVMDVQANNVSRVTLPPTYLPLMASTIASARSQSIPIIYVVISFRANHPECSPVNPVFSMAKSSNIFVTGSPGTETHSSIAPQPEDIVVVKKRVSAFVGSDLELVLRSLGVGKLVLTGMATGGVVLSTVCEAADKDFELVVLRDLCFDQNEGLHDTLMDHIFSKRGKVMRAEKWVEGMKA